MSDELRQRVRAHEKKVAMWPTALPERLRIHQRHQAELVKDLKESAPEELKKFLDLHGARFVRELANEGRTSMMSVTRFRARLCDLPDGIGDLSVAFRKLEKTWGVRIFIDRDVRPEDGATEGILVTAIV